MFRLTSLNLNGIRAAYKKGLANWLATQKPDVVCLQEIKISNADLSDDMRNPDGYQGFFEHAEKKGYSGVGIYTRLPFQAVKNGMGCPEFDAEGRIIRMDFEALSVISAYLPSGSSSEERHAAKFRFLAAFEPFLTELQRERRETGREFIICGDWNIAHQNIDLKNWKGNQKNSGFTPEERAWMSAFLASGDWVDVFRTLYPEREAYTWWSNRGQAWAKDVGWRIDYQMATPGIAALARKAEIYKDERFSDHAPLCVFYDTELS